MAKGLPKANLTDNARQVLMKRYVRRGDDGKPAENVEEMFWRVAHHVAKVEAMWDGSISTTDDRVLPFIIQQKFFRTRRRLQRRNLAAGSPHVSCCRSLTIPKRFGGHLPNVARCGVDPADGRREWLLVLTAATQGCYGVDLRRAGNGTRWILACV
jgi:ribonucleotide reductase alpha subunit